MGILSRRRDRLRHPLDDHEMNAESQHTLALAETKFPGATAAANQVRAAGVAWPTILFAILQGLLQNKDILTILLDMLSHLGPNNGPAPAQG